MQILVFGSSFLQENIIDNVHNCKLNTKKQVRVILNGLTVNNFSIIRLKRANSR